MNHTEILDKGIDLLIENGVNEIHAEIVMDSLVETSLRGIDSHGVNLLKRYIDSIQNGKIEPNNEPEIVFENDVFLNVSGNKGFGQITARFAIEKGIEKVKKNGIAVVGLKNTNHIGTLGQYNKIVSDEGYMCFSVCNGGANVAPFGGYKRFFGTNPIAFSVPVKDSEPIVIDFATSIFPESKIRNYKDDGLELPNDIILDKFGKKTTNPNDFYEGGSILPIGGHKGSGLSMMVEILGGLFTGAGFWALGESTSTNGVMFILIDPTTFIGEQFHKNIHDFITELKSQPTIDGVDEILLPGEIELKTKKWFEKIK